MLMTEFKPNRYEVDLDRVAHYNQDLKIKTLAELIHNSATRYTDRPFLGEKVDGAYRWMTYGEFEVEMLRVRALFKKYGIEKGDRIAIIANNSVPFALAAYAAYGLGAVIVPMYEVQAKSDWQFIFGDATPKLAIVKNDAIRCQIEMLETPGLEHIFVIAPQSAKSFLDEARQLEPLDAADDVATEDDLCDIIYTSGTTGRPHGVELTHKNVAHDIVISAWMFDYCCEDRVLSFLPWAHGFGKTVDFGLFPALGAAVGLAESTKTIAQNLTEVRPTVLCAVPKIFNGIYEKLHIKLEGKRAMRALFARAQRIMHEARTRKLRRLERLEYKLMDKLVGSKIRDVFGGCIKFCVSGGASLSPEIATFFEDFGIRVFEGYGMTEHSPVISINYNADKIGSVGVPLPTVKVEIEPIDAEDAEQNASGIGEIVISSDCIMRGYHNDDEGTRAVIDEQGRLHTGDTGYIDDDGYIYIMGRIKEQYKLANGKFVVPSAIETRICASPDIDFAILYGAGMPYNVVLLRPSSDFIAKVVAANRLGDIATDARAEHPAMRVAVAKVLESATQGLRGYENPQKFAVILDDWSIANGILTPALKIKRREVEKRYADLIQSLYNND